MIFFTFSFSNGNLNYSTSSPSFHIANVGHKNASWRRPLLHTNQDLAPGQNGTSNLVGWLQDQNLGVIDSLLRF